MSLIDKTMPRVSTLIVDADKDWLGYKIRNLNLDETTYFINDYLKNKIFIEALIWYIATG